jgi:PAS domain S-box-containing protein
VRSLPAPVLFGAHLLAFLVALTAALALVREQGRKTLARAAACLGFLGLAAAEAYHGAGFASDVAAETLWLRTGGYVALLAAALIPGRPATATPAVAGVVPGGAATPAIAAAAAGILQALRRRGQRGGVWLGVGLLVLAAADALLWWDREWSRSAAHLLLVGGYLCVARTVVALTRHSLRFRFLAGFTALLVAVVLFVSLVTGTVIDRNLREGAFTRVLGQTELAQDRLEDRVSDEVARLVLLSEVRAIAQAIRQGKGVRTELIESLRTSLFPDVDFILFLDRRGAVAGRYGVRPDRAIQVVGTDVVRYALRRDQEVSSIDAVADRGLALIGVAPIRQRGTPDSVGFAVAGFFVDGDLLEGEVIAGPDSRAAAFQGFRGRSPRLVARVGFRDDGPLAPPEVLEEAFRGFLMGGRPFGRTLSLDGSEHFAALAPLSQAVERPVGILLVAEPAAVVAETQREVNQVLFLVTVAVIGLAFVVAVAAARRITRPLVALTGAARRVQAGDLRAKAEVRGEDEVAALAVAFNRMTDSVSGMTGDLREAAAEQTRLRARLETVVNSMGDGLIAVDGDRLVVTYNPAAATMLGRPAGQVMGRPLREVLPMADLTGRPVEPAATGPGGLAFVRRPDGAEVPVAVSSAPLRGAGGLELGRVYVLRDMSREHEVERMKTEFLTNVSHELRTPLTPIIGFAELMVRRDVPGDQAREFAGSILDSARRLERIVAMLVDFSAIEAGRVPVATHPLAVRSLVEETVEGWRERNARHRFQTEVPDGLPAADVDGHLFRRMLDELLDNAVKYSPDGGPVTVSVSPENSGQRRMLRIEVADRGIGIEPEDLAGIFQDFRQVDASNTRAFGGLGLGLTFVKRLAEAHGGQVQAVSEPGRGSTFGFTVPAADGDRGSA